MKPDPTSPTRRNLLTAGLAMPALLLPGLRVAWSQAAELPVTPMCGEDPTPRDYEGPFFKPRSPMRTSLLDPGVTGAKLVLSGYVMSKSCKPLAGAVLDFWHCDTAGRYDNAGYRLRGHQFTDEAGRYRLETIFPGEYPGRTRHIHVKVQAKHGPLLTTQLYFPNNPANENDFLFKPALLMMLTEADAGKMGRFDFVLDVA
ncbi:MAG TPA: intradiol ring-cleavage dioxygenase [Burkholderiales bacterium]|jgi:protocatechuate 3,4-dioxygenase beta subunit|nr:intradiol ring-cleavage dioxygenase [Burkholderiales bacterium]